MNSSLSEIFQKLSSSSSTQATPILVDTPSRLAACLAVLASSSELAVDCEGDDLCAKGTLSLIQLYQKESDIVWIVDVTVLKSAAFMPVSDVKLPSLKCILEDASVTKLFYDVRNDANALFHLHSISLRGIFDVQLHELAFRQSSSPHRRTCGLLHGLRKAIQQHLPGDVGTLATKDSASRLFARGWHILDERPLAAAVIKWNAGTMRVSPIADLPPEPPTPESLPRLRPSPYPSRTAPRHLNLRTRVHDHYTKAIPNEIIYLVLDMLDDEDLYDYEYEEPEDGVSDEPYGARLPCSHRLEALARCCRVSRAFLPKSRELLYRAIKFHEDNDFKVMTFLSGNVIPHLAAIVRTFTITVTHLYDDECLYFGLRAFPNLETLRICIAGRHKPGEILSGVTKLILQRRASERPTRFKLAVAVEPRGEEDSFEYFDSISTLLEGLPHLTHLSLVGTWSLPLLDGRPLPFHLVDLSLAESNFDLYRLESLTKNSQSTLTSLFLADITSEQTLPLATFDLMSQFPLHTLEILDYALPQDSLSLTSLPDTLKNLSIPETSAVVPFLGSGACPNLQTFECDGWRPTPAEERAAEEAVSSRGLFIVETPYIYPEWGQVEWEYESWD
ncbi:hypothetical protein RQP46_003998 [Phenoliferia psychrophenolica]